MVIHKLCRLGVLLLLFLALAFPLLALQAQRPTAPNGVPAVRTVDYEATAVSLPNPERGFYGIMIAPDHIAQDKAHVAAESRYLPRPHLAFHFRQRK